MPISACVALQRRLESVCRAPSVFQLDAGKGGALPLLPDHHAVDGQRAASSQTQQPLITAAAAAAAAAAALPETV